MKFTTTTFLLFLIYSISYSQQNFNSYHFSINGIDYQVLLEAKTWVEAADIAYSTGGILAEINSEEEQDSIFYHLNKADINLESTRAPDGGNAPYIWIGGNDIEKEGIWVWDGANDKLTEQFWEGTFEGSPINGLYNNWGNEPDNFSNQDALGLALANWPRGVAGEWNDVNQLNKLFFLIEYDKSVLKINQLEYTYDDKNIFIIYRTQTALDSLHLLIDDLLYKKIENIEISDTTIKFDYPVDQTKLINLRLVGFFGNKKSTSKNASLEIYSFNNHISSYLTDFEDLPVAHFIGTGFNIDKPFAFMDYAIHSQHDYESISDLTLTLIYPIIVNEDYSNLTYSEVAIIEPGEINSNFGDSNFNDYVIVEGSKNFNEWLPLLDGYDASLYPEWLDAWNNGALYRNLYKARSINIKETFETGDTILIRFRLHSNEDINGWGWTIDSLIIQDFPHGVDDNLIVEKEYILEQNYPNPFNPRTRITFSLPADAKVKLVISDLLGKEVTILRNEIIKKGEHTIDFDAANLPTGVYYLNFLSEGYKKSIKMMLLK